MALAVPLLLVATAGCGGDDGDAAPPPTTEATTSTDAPGAAGPGEPEGVVVIGHRGASAEAPEHTFPAYDLALEQGADYIEQDLQMTADGVLVVVHDDTLDRTARGPAGSCTGPVAEKTLEQLRDCEVGSWFAEEDPSRADDAFIDLPIPTMAEVLDRYGPDERYYVEIKQAAGQEGMEEALLAVLDDAGLGTPQDGSRQVLVQSFDAKSLQRLHALRPEIPLVQLVRIGEPLDEAALDGVAGYAVGIGPAFPDVDAALVASAHDRCLVVHPYTVNEPDQMAALLDLGVDGMFTDEPAVLDEQRSGRPAPAMAEGCDRPGSP